MAQVRIRLENEGEVRELSRRIAGFEGPFSLRSAGRMVNPRLPEEVLALELAEPLELHYEVREANLLVEISEFLAEQLENRSLPDNDGKAARTKPEYLVVLTDTKWIAGENDTLMNLLTQNTKIIPAAGTGSEEGPYLYQVKYRSEDSGILIDNDRFSSKGIFRKTGKVTVYIEQAAVYDGADRHVVGINRPVEIEVAAAAKPVGVLDYLKGLKGSGTLSAMHNKEPNQNPRSSWDRVIADTGVTPAVWSGDFLYAKEDVKYRQRMINEAITQWNDGALVNLMFHVPTPLRTAVQEQEGASWTSVADGNSVQYDLSDEEWSSLLMSGGRLNKVWKERLDVYAFYLQQLKDAGVVPMVRPFHEMNQYIFWWNCEQNPENTRNLYRMTKDYLVEEKGLDQMIWLWNVQDFDNRMKWEMYDPDTEDKQYWDILTLDVYEDGYSEAFYRNMQKYCKGRPIAVGECWRLFQPEQMAQRRDYVFAMPWADDTWVMNSEEQIRAFYRNAIGLMDTPVFVNEVLL